MEETLFCPECQEDIFPIRLRECKEEWGIEIECECKECGYVFVNGI